MDEIELPEQLKGPWHHALILTYGLDVPFFENALRGLFSTRCRNQIILSDGRQYLEASANYARSGLVRHMNQRYVAEGIFAARAAHAKLILLTNPQRGRLLVGSGNLRWQGYASGGELFTRYEYKADAPEMLNAFLGVRELLEGLVSRRYISAMAERRVRHLLENTPWLYQSPTDDHMPVRHNLQQSFIEQLAQVVGNEKVEELWVLSPFYDAELIALRRLLDTLNPRQTYLLMQPSWTSIDASILQDVLDDWAGLCQVCAVTRDEDSAYVHAKLYLAKLPNHTVCLQGSPNLSRVAMLLTVPHANIELANLLVGQRDAFDDLLDALDIREVEQLDALELSYQSPTPPAYEPSAGWYLTGGEWHADRLYVTFHGMLPDLEGASLVIAEQVFPLNIRKRGRQHLELGLNAEAHSLLARPMPVLIRWGEGEDTQDSNPIFICNRATLDAELQIREDDGTLQGVGDLDLDDEEFERLLGELDAALMIDRRSVWQLAGRRPPATTDDDDEALRLGYAEIDYDMLRQHPKVKQYATAAASGPRYARTRLQIILNAITDHFRGLLDVSASVRIIDEAAARIVEMEQGAGETEDEREEEETEKQRRRRSQSQRVARILKRFIRRYLRGIQSPDFQELAGYEVVAHNYEIFAHILWRLFAKDWMEREFIIESLLNMWTFFWGRDEDTGYFGALDEQQQAQVRQWVNDYHADAELLAALYYGAYLTDVEQWQDLRFALRDFWRGMLCQLPFEVTTAILEVAWRAVARLIPYQPPSPSAIVDGLMHLARFETRDSFLRELEERHQLPKYSCSFEPQNVWREPLGRKDRVDCLVVSAKDALLDKGVAVTMLREWMRFEILDYFRIHVPVSGQLVYYEGLRHEGLFWDRDEGEMSIGRTTAAPSDWDEALSRMQALAAEVDQQLTFILAKEQARSSKSVPARSS